MRPIGSTSLVMLREDCVCNMVGIRETKINDDGAHLHRGGDGVPRIGYGTLEPLW